MQYINRFVLAVFSVFSKGIEIWSIHGINLVINGQNIWKLLRLAESFGQAECDLFYVWSDVIDGWKSALNKENENIKQSMNIQLKVGRKYLFWKYVTYESHLLSKYKDVSIYINIKHIN